MRDYSLYVLFGWAVVIVALAALALGGCVGVTGQPITIDQLEMENAIRSEAYDYGFVDGCLGTILVTSQNPGTYEQAIKVCNAILDLSKDGELEGIPSEIKAPKAVEEPVICKGNCV